jgi:hypothetical protein
MITINSRRRPSSVPVPENLKNLKTGKPEKEYIFNNFKIFFPPEGWSKKVIC